MGVPKYRNHCWWECELVQPLWKTLWRSINEKKIDLHNDPEIALLGIYPKDSDAMKRRDTCTLRFIYFFFKFLFIYDSHRERERGRNTGRGRSSLHAPGARCGIRSWVSRIAPWAKGRHQTTAPPRDPPESVFEIICQRVFFLGSLFCFVGLYVCLYASLSVF